MNNTNPCTDLSLLSNTLDVKSAKYLVAAKNSDGLDFLFQTDVKPSRHLLEFAEFLVNIKDDVVMKNRYSHLPHSVIWGKVAQLQKSPVVDEKWLFENHLMGELWDRVYNDETFDNLTTDIKEIESVKTLLAVENNVQAK